MVWAALLEPRSDATLRASRARHPIHRNPMGASDDALGPSGRRRFVRKPDGPPILLRQLSKVLRTGNSLKREPYCNSLEVDWDSHSVYQALGLFLKVQKLFIRHVLECRKVLTTEGKEISELGILADIMEPLVCKAPAYGRLRSVDIPVQGLKKSRHNRICADRDVII